MPSTPPPSQWWAFLPISRLYIQDEPDSLRKPLFGDATLLSVNTLNRIFKENSQDHGNGDDISSGLISWPLTKADTYLAVRRRGVVNTEWFDEDRKNEIFIKEVQRRATQISALLTVTCLATSTEGHLCGLSDQFYKVTKQMALLEIGYDQRVLLTESSGYSVDTFDCSVPDDLTFSGDELRSFLDQPITKGLVQILTAHKPNVAKSLYTSINQACVRLASAILADSYTSQLLGAITCIELLLTNENQSTNFAKIENRLSTLIGTKLLEKYEFKNILGARHAYVHRGEEVDAREYPLQVTGIAICALLLYANVAHQFKRKDSFLTYLDMLDLKKDLESWEDRHASEINRDILDEFKCNLELPIFEFVDDTIEFDQEYNMGLYDRFDRVYSDDLASGKAAGQWRGDDACDCYRFSITVDGVVVMD